MVVVMKVLPVTKEYEDILEGKSKCRRYIE
jgi:hypothetical protein